MDNIFSKVGFIWDIDGVVVDSPHESAWRVTAERWKLGKLSTEFYFEHVASRPRYEGGDNILRLMGGYKKFKVFNEREKSELLKKFCDEKNQLVRKLISDGNFKVFENSVRFIRDAREAGIIQAAASASKNVMPMLRKAGLVELFDLNFCGIDVSGGKKELFEMTKRGLLKLRKLDYFFIFEDAPSGISAAKSLGMFSIGVHRIGRREALISAGADIVIKDFSQISLSDITSIIHK